eukprot:gnl/TRDRNA2_/TRDRNA2_176498_c0_seq7.p1 gnl/TRDRNA2_/TRDRNA2_176498_c0~~gnl/TRDRNA2_/TRDRNA2_176498_c0_seq7.p1  ORF type:complete len:271 (+),score=56.74 gnl/TRDRNA2_/TRDRNA2_176498_c0_seq7:99-815(+)
MAGDGFTRGSLQVRAVTQPASVHDSSLDQVELSDDEDELAQKMPVIKPQKIERCHTTTVESDLPADLAAPCSTRPSCRSSKAEQSQAVLFEQAKMRRTSVSALLKKAGLKREDKLSPEAKRQIVTLFRKMDADGNSEVSREEANRFFQGQFGKLSANAMFNEVDTDNSDAITAAEFLSFWKQVKRNGYSDQDIIDELGELLQGNAWVDWDDQRQTYDITHTHSTTTYQKQLSCKTLAA